MNQLDVGMLVIETAFGDCEQLLAERSRHHSPATLAEELAQISSSKQYPIYITHTKPTETEEIMSQIGLLGTGFDADGANAREIRWLEAGTVMEIIGMNQTRS